MSEWPRPGTGVAVALALLGVAACAPATTGQPEVATDFPRLMAQETLATGYRRIAEKYIDTVSVETAAMEGLRGLGALDPSLTVSQADGMVALAAGQTAVGRYPLPTAGDADAWAALTVDMTADSRATSREMRRADTEAIYQAVFDGALSTLDIFSRYAGQAEARDHRAKREGFGGIGISYVAEADGVRITRVLDATPAERTGLRPGDLIVAIDGDSAAGLWSRAVARRLRGPIGSRLSVSVRRDGTDAPADFTITRAHIVPRTVTTRLTDGVLFTRVSSFNQDTAASLEAAIVETRENATDDLLGIILDLRGNPGGLLKQAVRVADLFMAEGAIISTRGRHPDSVQHYEATGRDLTGDLPLVVLVDGKSASAAEIVAAALQDQGRAVVIGTASFGKGTVQTVIRMPNDGEITLTWSRLYSPSGYALQGLGVRPHICTSGFTGDGIEDVGEALTAATDVASVLASWRRVALDDVASRKKMRSACPAQPRRDQLESRIARRVLTDPALYAHSLDGGGAIAAAGN